MPELLSAALEGDRVNFACPSCHSAFSWAAAQFRESQEEYRVGTCDDCRTEFQVGNPFRLAVAPPVLHTVAPVSETALISPEIMPRRPLFFVHSKLNGQTYGPADGATIRQWLVARRVVATDSVCQAGSSEWIPILRSEFASAATDEIRVQQLSAATCPRCSASMVAVIRRSGAGLLLIILGVLLTPFIIGIPLWIIGYSMRFGGKGKIAYQCPRCNFSTA